MSERTTTELARNMFAVGRMIREQVKRNVGPNRLSPMQVQCLLCVWEERPVMHDAARRLAITPPSATVLARGLVRLGLIRRTRDANDRRIWRLELTPRGGRLIERRLGAVTEGLARVADALTAPEKRELTRLLRKIAASRHESPIQQRLCQRKTSC